MENYNEQNGKRRVSRQSWKPGAFYTAVKGLWTAAYSILKVVIAALATVLVIAGVCVVVFVGVLADYLEGDVMPQAGVQLEGFDLDQPSYVYYLDELDNIQVLQKLHATNVGEWAEFEEIPQAMIDAAVSIEDRRFFEHQGVDWFTTIKACINMFVGGGSSFGGSSITQQLIKNMLLTENEDANDVTVQRKVIEIFHATAFEKKYDKSVVLEWYLNYIYLGNGCQGVKSAAEKYFGKELEDLTPAECACIISITNNPTIFNPIGTKEITYKGETRTAAEWNHIRKEDTLWTMHEYGHLTDAEYIEALAQELVFTSGIPFEDRYSSCQEEQCGYRGHNDTFVEIDGVYYCPVCDAVTTIGEDASEEVYSWFVDQVIEEFAEYLANQDGVTITDKNKEMYLQLVCSGGYHIYTTLDMEAQEAVDKIYTDLSAIPTTSSLQQLESGLILIDNKSGDIIAMAGGVGDKVTFDAYNRATDADLQPGSSLKPLTIYAPAFELGLISPVTVMPDLPLYYYDKETGKVITSMSEAEGELSSFPKNDTKSYSYSYSIYQGIVSSVNAVAVNTLDTMGLEYSFNFAKNKFKIDTLVETYTTPAGTILSDIAYSPLGMGAPTLGVTVRDMAEAFATFANGGVWREARTYTHVYNYDGELVYHNEQDSEQIISEKTVDYMNYCLTNAVKSGTGKAAAISGQVVAGKTGTTSSAKDRWFCGFTNHYTAAVWCGYDQPEVMQLTGLVKTNPACRLFNMVLSQLHKGKTTTVLYDEEKLIEVSICKDSGLLATDACKEDCRGTRIVTASAYLEDLPTEYCTAHIEVDYCTGCEAPANQYCYYYEKLGMTTITKTSLVKLTEKQVEKILMACDFGLSKTYKDNDYIYLVDEYGNPAPFFGIEGNKNTGLNYPYVVGTKHTAGSWAAYLAANPNAGDVMNGDNSNPGDNTTTDPTDNTEETTTP